MKESNYSSKFRSRSLDIATRENHLSNLILLKTNVTAILQWLSIKSYFFSRIIALTRILRVREQCLNKKEGLETTPTKVTTII